MNSKCGNRCAGTRPVGRVGFTALLETLKCVVAVLLVLATSSTASAATLYWNTTTTALWSGTSNWSTAVSSGGTYALAPTSADLLNFNQYNVQGSTTVQLDGSAAAMGIWFNNERSTTIEASAVGTQTLTLFTGGTAGNFSNQLNFFPGTGPVTIGHATKKVAITLNGLGSWNNSSSSTVTVLNDLNLNGLALVFASSGNPSYAPLGNSVFAGSITGTGAGSKLTVAGVSLVTLSGSNSFAGGITIDSAARLNINNAYALGSGTLTIGNTLTNKQFDNTSGAPITLATNNPISWNSGGSGLGGVFVGSNNLNLGTGNVTWVQSSSVHVLNNTLTIGGAITSGSTNFNLEKWGTGKLVLSGSSGSYSGTAWINDGTLQIDGYFSGGVASSVFNGLGKYVILSGTGRIGGGVNLNASTYSAIDLANGSVDSLRIDGALIMGGANYAHFDLGSGAAGADFLTVGGTVTPTASWVGLNQIGGVKSPITPGSYTLIRSGSTMPTTGLTLVTTKAFGETFSLSASGTTLNVAVATGTAGPSTAFWGGGSNATWSTASNNWKIDAAGTANSSGVPGYQTNVTFTASGAASGTTTLGSDFDVNSLSFSDSAPAMTIAGTNMLTIEAADYNGNTAGNGITLATPSSGSPAQSITSRLGLASNQTWTVGSGATLNVTGTISDFGGGYTLTKAGAGTLFLSGANGYGGGTILNEGTLLFDTSATFADPVFGTGVLTLNSGTLQNSRAGGILRSMQSWNGDFTVAGQDFSTSDHVVPMLEKNVNLTVNNNFTIKGLSDRGNNYGLTKSGTGRLIFGVGSMALRYTYTGTTTLNSGELRLDTNFSGSGPFTINGGTLSSGTNLLTLSNPQNWNGDFTVSGTSSGATSWTIAGPATLGGDRTLTVNVGTLTMDGGIGDGGNAYGLTKTGTGTLSLSGFNTYTGPTTISSGTLQVVNGGYSNISGGLLGSGTYAGNIVNNSAFNFASVQNQILSGAISGTGLFLNTTTGTLTLSGSNSYSGTTKLNGGVLSLANSDALGTSGPIVFGGGTMQFTGSNTVDYSTRIVSSTSAMAFNTNGQTATFSGVLVASNTAGLTKTGSGSLILTGENLYTGTTTISTGTLQVGNGGSTGSIATGIVTNAASLVFNRNNPITYAGAIGGTGSLTLQGAGTLTLTGSSTYTGATAVQNGAIVLAGGNNRLATTGTVTLGGSTTVGNLILGDVSGPTNQTLGLIAASGSGGRIVGGNAAFSMLTVNNATSGTFAGTIGGSGVNESNLNLTKSGVGMLTLTAANTLYSGTTTMNGGFLTLGSSTALGTSGPITFTGGGIGYTSASAGVDLASRFKNSTSAITISTNYLSPVTIAGSIDSTNSGGLMLSSGTLTLSGSNSYSGNTTVWDASGSYALTRLNIANPNALGSGSLVMNYTNSFDNTSGGPLTLNTNLLLAAGSPYFAGSNNITFSGTGLFSGAASLAVNSGTLTLGSLNTDTVTRAVNMGGGGTLQLAGPAGPTFATSTSGIAMSSGRLLISDPNALGPKAFIYMGGGSFESTVDLSGSNALPNYLYVGNIVAFTGTNNITFSGTVGHDAPNAPRAINSNLTNGAALTLAGPVLLQSNTTALVARTLDIGGTGLTLISGPISNGVVQSNGLSKSGWGTLTLTGTNTFTGGFTLSNGNVIIGNKSALGSGTIALSGGTLQASSSMSGANAITNATISLTGAASMITGSSDITLTGSLVSTGGFTKAGSHTLTLTGSSTYSGATAVQDGTLVLAGGNNRVVSASGLTFGTGTSFGRLVLGDASGPSNNTFGLITTTGSGGTIVGGNAAVSILTASSASSGTFGGVIGGLGTNENSLAFTKSGAGTLTLTNANTYSGTTSISGGVLSLANASAIGPGAITFGGGTMQLTAASALDYSSRIVSSTSAIAIDTNGQSLTFSSPLVSSNTAGLTKNGTGTLTLSVGNLYSGTTTFTGGVVNIRDALALGGTAAGTLVTGGALQLQGGIAVGNESLSLAGLGDAGVNGVLRNISGDNTWAGLVTLTAASRINSDSGTLTLSNTGAIAGTGFGLTVGGSGNTVINGGISNGSGGLIKDGTGTLVLSGSGSFTGAITNNLGTINVRSSGAFGTGAGLYTSPYSGGIALELQDNVTIANPMALLGSGINSGGNLRNISGNNTLTGSWSFGSAGVSINSLSGTLSLSNTSAITASGALTIDGVGDTNIAGGLRFTTGSLLKNGTGTLRLTGSNAWAGVGSLFINQGTVALSGSGRLGLGAASNMLSIAGGTLDMGGISDTVAGGNGVQISQPNSAILNGTLTTGVFAVSNNSGTATVSAVMAGTTGLTKSGSGTLLLTAANTYSGATGISGGSVLLTGAGRLGTGTAALTFTGTTALTLLDLGGLSRTVGALSIASGSTTLQNGSLTGTSYSVSNASGTATISASLLANGTIGLAKSGAGWLVLSNSNTYTGTTTVTAGALNIQNALALGGTAAGTVVTVGSLELQGGITVAGEALSLGSAVTTGGLRNISGNNTWDGLVTLTAASQINSDSGTLTLSNLGTITGTTFGLVVGGSGNTVLNSILGTTTGTLIKNGTGTLTLTAANTYIGTTTVSAGVLALQNALALGGTAGGTYVANGGALQLQGGITVLNEVLQLSGTGLATEGLWNLSGNNTWTGPVTIGNSGPKARITSESGTLTVGGNIGGTTLTTLTIAGSGDTVLSGNVNHTSGSNDFIKTGSGRLTLSGSNSYSGPMTLQSGTILLSNTFALANSTLTTTAAAGSFVFDSSVAGNAFTIGGLSGGLSIPLVNNASTPAPVALTVSTITTTTYSGSLSGGGSLIKSNVGSLVLSGSNSYSGTTLISGGRLQFATVNSLYGGDSASSWTKANITVTTGGMLGMNVGGSDEFTTGNVTTLLANLGGAVTTAGLRAGSAIGFDTSNASGGTFTVANTIANTTGTGGGSVGLAKYGTGTLVLAGPNSYTGGTIINGGTITLGNAFGLGNSGTSAFRINAGTLNLNGYSVNLGVLSSSSGAVAVITTSAASGTTTLTAWNNGGYPANTYYGTIADNGDGKVALVMPAGGDLPLAGNNTFSGGTTIAATSTLELTGAGTLGSGPIVMNGSLWLRGGGSTLSNAISGNGTLTVFRSASTPIYFLSATTTIFTGSIAVSSNDGQVPVTLQLASLSGTGGGIDIGSGTGSFTLRYVGSGNTTSRVLNMAGTTGGSTLDASGSGPLVFSSAMTATGAGIKTLTLTGSSTAANSIAAIPNSSAATSVNKTGNGTWRMTGTSSFTGQLTVTQGTIVAAVGTGPSGNGVFGQAVSPSLLPQVGDSAAGASGFAAMLLEGGVVLNRSLQVAALGSGANQLAILGGANTSGTSTFAYNTEIRIGRGVSLQAATGGTVDFGNVWLDSTGTGSPGFSYTIGTAGNLGTVRLSNPLATTSGSVSINYGTLLFGADNQVASSTPVSIGSSDGNGTLNLGGNSLALSRLNFNGAGSFGGTVANSGAGTLRMQDGSAAALINVNSGTAHAINSAIAMANNTTVSVANSAQIAINGAISGAFGLNKIGSGALTLSGNSVYAGQTSISAGTLVVNGSLASTAGLNVDSGAFLGGSGSLASTIAGAGLVGPGNSPGILTALAVDPSAGTAFSFEMTGTGAPAWSVASASVNDVLHLTSASPFTSTLNSSNAVNIYFQVASLAAGDTFQGGFFTDATLAQSNLLTNVSAGQFFNYFVQGDGSGSNPYNGVNYYTFEEYLGLVPSITGVTMSTQTVASANFATGTVTNGQVVELVIVPEPDTMIFAGIGIGMAAWSIWKRRRIAQIMRAK